MKKLLFLFLIMCSDVLAGNGSGQVSTTATLGGPIGTNNPIVMPLGAINKNVYSVTSASANGGAPTSGHYYSFGKQANTGGQWKVASGKIAVCAQMLYSTTTATASRLQFGYATATFSNDASSVTGGVCYSPTGSCTNVSDGGYRFNSVNSDVNLAYNYPVIFDASATGANADIYPFCRPDGTAIFDISLLCYEQ